MVEWKPPRWERELDKPEPTVAVYLRESSARTLKYYLTAVAREDPEISLSEALDLLGNEWNKLDGKRMRCEATHGPYSKVIEKARKKKHRKCTKDKCKRRDFDDCPVWEW